MVEISNITKEFITREEIDILHPISHNTMRYNYVVVDKKDNIVLYSSFKETNEFIKKLCYPLINFEIDYIPWEDRIVEYMLNSIKKNQKYKGYRFYFYDKRWERKIKIEKLLNL